MAVTNLTLGVADGGDNPYIGNSIAYDGDKNRSLRLAHSGDKPYPETWSWW